MHLFRFRQKKYQVSCVEIFNFDTFSQLYLLLCGSWNLNVKDIMIDDHGKAGTIDPFSACSARTVRRSLPTVDLRSELIKC